MKMLSTENWKAEGEGDLGWREELVFSGHRTKDRLSVKHPVEDA